ncbi:hypothetical protein GQ42DRAFT_158279 [Ramicandelaber brevisporus]|nr:hypothetical protein GQ42DRAFT_158279 [Ramicandelaber brevisporus]
MSHGDQDGECQPSMAAKFVTGLLSCAASMPEDDQQQHHRHQHIVQQQSHHQPIHAHAHAADMIVPAAPPPARQRARTVATPVATAATASSSSKPLEVRVDHSTKALTSMPSLGPCVTHAQFQMNRISSLSLSALSLSSTTLRVLDLSNNKLVDLPTDFNGVALPSLVELYLGHNLLARLPDDFGRFSRLEVLDLGFNNLVELPVSMKELKTLQHLDLRYNQLPCVPLFLGELYIALTRLYFDGNPLDKQSKAVSKALMQACCSTSSASASLANTRSTGQPGKSTAAAAAITNKGGHLATPSPSPHPSMLPSPQTAALIASSPPVIPSQIIIPELPAIPARFIPSSPQQQQQQPLSSYAGSPFPVSPRTIISHLPDGTAEQSIESARYVGDSGGLNGYNDDERSLIFNGNHIHTVQSQMPIVPPMSPPKPTPAALRHLASSSNLSGSRSPVVVNVYPPSSPRVVLGSSGNSSSMPSTPKQQHIAPASSNLMDGTVRSIVDFEGHAVSPSAGPAALFAVANAQQHHSPTPSPAFKRTEPVPTPPMSPTAISGAVSFGSRPSTSHGKHSHQIPAPPTAVHSTGKPAHHLPPPAASAATVSRETAVRHILLELRDAWDLCPLSWCTPSSLQVLKTQQRPVEQFGADMARGRFELPIAHASISVAASQHKHHQQQQQNHHQHYQYSKLLPQQPHSPVPSKGIRHVQSSQHIDRRAKMTISFARDATVYTIPAQIDGNDTSPPSIGSSPFTNDNEDDSSDKETPIKPSKHRNGVRNRSNSDVATSKVKTEKTRRTSFQPPQLPSMSPQQVISNPGIGMRIYGIAHSHSASSLLNDNGQRRSSASSINSINSINSLNGSAKAQRTAIVHELLISEQQYVTALECIAHVYVKSAVRDNLISLDLLRVIFGNTSALLQLHRDRLMPELRRAALESGWENVATVFNTFAEQLEHAYSHHTGGDEVAMLALSNVYEASPGKVQKFLETCRLHPLHLGPHIQHYMQVAQQRIAEYRGIIERLSDLIVTVSAVSPVSSAQQHQQQQQQHHHHHQQNQRRPSHRKSSSNNSSSSSSNHISASNTVHPSASIANSSLAASYRSCLATLTNISQKMEQTRRDGLQRSKVLQLQLSTKGAEKIPLAIVSHRRLLRESILRLDHIVFMSAKDSHSHHCNKGASNSGSGKERFSLSAALKRLSLPIGSSNSSSSNSSKNDSGSRVGNSRILTQVNVVKQNVHVALFNDMLLICTINNNSNNRIDSINTHAYEVFRPLFLTTKQHPASLGLASASSKATAEVRMKTVCLRVVDSTGVYYFSDPVKHIDPNLNEPAPLEQWLFGINHRYFYT